MCETMNGTFSNLGPIKPHNVVVALNARHACRQVSRQQLSCEKVAEHNSTCNSLLLTHSEDLTLLILLYVASFMLAPDIRFIKLVALPSAWCSISFEGNSMTSAGSTVPIACSLFST